jgi:hypothetical protein
MTTEAKLEQARRNLLELSTRNRLINMPRRRKRAKVVEIAGERSDEVFRILVLEGREMMQSVCNQEQGGAGDCTATSSTTTSARSNFVNAL